MLSVPGLPAAAAPARRRAAARRVGSRPGLPARRSLPRRLGPGARPSSTPRGLDIYGRERVVREIYSLATTVQPGNSGGPLLDTEGRVVGVIFAKSLEDDATGYALTLAEAKPVLDAATSAGSRGRHGRLRRRLTAAPPPATVEAEAEVVGVACRRVGGCRAVRIDNPG